MRKTFWRRLLWRVADANLVRAAGADHGAPRGGPRDARTEWPGGAALRALLFNRGDPARLGGRQEGIFAWRRFNKVFEYMPMAALINGCILGVHGGIGRHLETLREIRLRLCTRPAQ